MFSPAELLGALRRRQRHSIRPLPEGAGMPPAWQGWLQAAGNSMDREHGPRQDEIVSGLLLRAPGTAPPAVPVPGGWRAFVALWREQWGPAPRDERGLRLLSGTGSFLLHLVLLVVLSWLLHVRFQVMPAEEAAAQQRGEPAIQVTFIERERPVDAVMVPPPVEVPRPEPAPRIPAPAPVTQAPLPEVSGAESLPVETAPAEEVQAQPLMVTETPEPEGVFRLPPVPEPELVPLPAISVEVVPRTREIELAVTEPVDLSGLGQVDVRVPAPELPWFDVDVAEREITVPPQPAPMLEIALPELELPAVREQEQTPRIRDIPEPAVPLPVQEAPEVAATPEPADAPLPDDRPVPAPVPAPAAVSGWPEPRARQDEWGQVTPEPAGGQRGTAQLFNPDGSPRLPPGSGQVGGGLPPGTITEDYEKIDRMGTWLKRPPTGHEPTGLDRYWVPGESLLQEWVRRSVRTVLIPIPGTGKTIRCDIVTLAVAGGCSIVDPDLQDSPARARPPPDIPFRPELHEDQEGLSDPLRR